MLLALDKFSAVSAGISDEEDPGAAFHGVGLALEIYAAGFFERAPQGVEVLYREGDVA